MPFSDKEGKDWATGLFVELVPGRVLDVGAGCGTYVDLWRPIYPDTWWAGVEVHRPYVPEYRLHVKYDELILADARRMDWFHWAEWDLVILGDVLEHMDEGEAREVWMHARRHSRRVLASIPIIHAPQGASFGNEHERHLETYDDERVRATFAGIEQWWTGNVIGVYLAPGS